MRTPPTNRVRIQAAVIQAVEAHADRDSPLECCGVLLGRGNEILHAVPVPNLAAEPSRFAADSLELIRVEHKARKAELAILGYYHSHPAGDPLPSTIDRDSVPWPDLPPYYHLIVAPGRGWAVYNTRDGLWTIVEVEVTADPPPPESGNE